MKIKTVTVVGANGTMGTNVSAIFASFGGAKVFMVSRDIKKSQTAVSRACSSVRAESIKSRLIPVDYSSLKDCVEQSDLVFESTSEDLDIKLNITSKIALYVKKGTIVCTGSSGLSITALAECFNDEQRKFYFGVHFFNPPYQLTLCELTATKYSDANVHSEIREYLTSVLFRSVVEVKDSPAFLGNRIGFQFINEAMQYAEQYKDNGGIDYIDSILGPYTGRAMAPIVTADFVGLDVHKAIVDNIYENTNDYAHESFKLPTYVQNLIDEGKLGKKVRCGLYKTKIYDNGFKNHLVYDISTGTYREIYQYKFPFAEEMKRHFNVGEYANGFKVLIDNQSQEANICLSFLLKYILYSLTTAKETAFNVYSAAEVMATGFTWCPPFAMIEALSTVRNVKKIMIERLDQNILKSVDLDLLFDNVGPSKYDYRKFFKSK